MDRDIKKHYSKVRWVLIFVLILNWGVAIAKIILGFLSRCESMTADGFHSLSDGASNIIGLVGITISSQPVDSNHPYGHKKYETFFSLGISTLLFVVAVNIARGGLLRFFHPEVPQVDTRSFIVMIVTMCVNAWVMWYEYRRGKELKSDMLIADSMHTKADILTSFSVIAALISIKSGYPIMDPIVTLMISLFIGYAAFKIVKDASRILCDSVVLDKKKISDIVLTVKGVKACHKIRTRGRPDDICIDMHVQVESSMHMKEAHKICYSIEEIIKNKIPEVSDVLIHIEPKEKGKK